ncbi:MAG: hypothetical protein AB1752_01960 [Candidatus Zixiibacteriota bacterium]
MFKRLTRSGIIALALTLFLLASCSSDKKSTNGGTTKKPPTLTTPQDPPTVTIDSDDPDAQAAEAMAQGLIGSATAFMGIAEGFLAPLDGAEWGDQVDGCWSFTYNLGGTCVWTYEVCEVENGYTWEIRYDGNCSGTVYDEWRAMSGSTDEEGHSGQIVYYSPNSTDVLGAFAWNYAHDGLSGGWDWYDGEIAEENITASFDWVINTDGSMDLVWETPGDFPTKWEAHVNEDGSAGSIVYYLWDGADYYKSNEIIWNSDGSGSSTTYDEDGNIITEDSWT